MGFFNIRWFCASVFLVSLTAQASKVSTEVAAGTTSYKVIKETVKTPIGTTVNSPRDINPVPRLEKLPSGGISQVAKGSLYIADKKANFSFSGAFKYTKDTLNKGTKTLLKRNPLSLAGSVGLMGLDALLRDAGLQVNDNGVIERPAGPNDYYPSGIPSGVPSSADITYSTTREFYSKNNYPPVGSVFTPGGYSSKRVIAGIDPPVDGKGYYYHCSAVSVSVCDNSGNCIYRVLTGYTISTCYYSNVSSLPEDDSPFTPVSDSEIDNFVDQFYNPDVSDIPAIFPYISPDSFELDPIPSFEFPSVTSTSTNPSTGLTTTTETKTKLDFDVDNSTSTPSITITETDTSSKYENGVKVDETVTSKPMTPSNSSTETGGGGVFDDVELNLPSFCSWASVVCQWFEWTKQRPEGAEPDLSMLIKDEDYSEDFEINFGSKQCPEPIILNLSLIAKPVEVSFQPFCDLAKYIYFLVMSASYIIAIRISLGVSNNG